MTVGSSANTSLKGLYCGSWSAPNLVLIEDVLQYAEGKVAEPDLTVHDLHNWRVRLAVPVGALLMALREFDVNGLELPPSHPLDGNTFAQKTKKRDKNKSEEWICRIVPRLLQPLWWQVMQDCRKYQQTGKKILCYLDEDLATNPFDLGKTLDFLTASIGKPEAHIRPYGLRHLGRTLLDWHGMSDEEIAPITNHWSNGSEYWNAIRTGADYSSLEERYNQACEAIISKLGLNPERWI